MESQETYTFSSTQETTKQEKNPDDHGLVKKKPYLPMAKPGAFTNQVRRQMGFFFWGGEFRGGCFLLLFFRFFWAEGLRAGCVPVFNFQDFRRMSSRLLRDKIGILETDSPSSNDSRV